MDLVATIGEETTVALAGLLAAVLAVSFALWWKVRLSRLEILRVREFRSLERAVERAGLSDRGGDPGGGARDALLIPDYLDREVLEDIARQKGVQVDPVRIDEGETHSITEESGSEMGANVGMPGVGGVGARVSGTRARQRARHRARSAEQFYSVRNVFRDLLDALEGDEELAIDLAFVPKASETDAWLFGSLMIAWGEWGLASLPEGDPRKELDTAIDTLADEALRNITEAKGKELEAAVPERGEVRFALIETEWTVLEEGDDLVLHNEWLVDAHARAERPTEILAAPGLLEVPIDQSKLVAMGRRRLQPGVTLWLRVFGKVDRYEAGTLAVLPILIAS